MVLLGVSAALFLCCAAITTVWCTSMSTTGGMPMPGGWAMSMAWMRMPGQTWLAAAASFLGMWIAMMVAMMLPSLFPTLCRYHQSVDAAGERRTLSLPARVAAAYFFVWIAFGMATFPLGVALADFLMRQPAAARAVPMAAALVALVAGALQCSAWKARRLACCRETPCDAADASMPWRFGLHLGLQCGLCCAGLMAVLFVIGIMNLQAMAFVTVAVTAERLAPSAARVARATGVIVIAAALLWLARAAGLG